MAARLILFQGNDARWYWQHKAGNNRIDNASEQGYRFKFWAKHKAQQAYPNMTVTVK